MSLSLLEQSHGHEWSWCGGGVSETCFAEFSIGIATCAHKGFWIPGLSLISNPVCVLDCANTLLCNFNSALRSILWFLITKPINVMDLFARLDVGKSIQSTLGYFTLFFAFCVSCKAWVAHILWIRNELPAIPSGLCSKCFLSVEKLAADQVPFVPVHFLLCRVTAEAECEKIPP